MSRIEAELSDALIRHNFERLGASKYWSGEFRYKPRTLSRLMFRVQTNSTDVSLLFRVTGRFRTLVALLIPAITGIMIAVLLYTKLLENTMVYLLSVVGLFIGLIALIFGWARIATDRRVLPSFMKLADSTLNHLGVEIVGMESRSLTYMDTRSFMKHHPNKIFTGIITDRNALILSLLNPGLGGAYLYLVKKEGYVKLVLSILVGLAQAVLFYAVIILGKWVGAYIFLLLFAIAFLIARIPSYRCFNCQWAYIYYRTQTCPKCNSIL